MPDQKLTQSKPSLPPQPGESGSLNPERMSRPEFDRLGQRRNASLAISLTFHGIVLALAVLLFSLFRAPPDDEPVRRGSIVLTSIDENEKEEFLTEQDIQEEVAEEVAAAAMAAQASQAAPALDVPAIKEDLPGPPPVDANPSVTEMTNESLTDVPSTEFELSEADLEAIAKEQRRLRARQPKGDPTSISIFNGTKLTGRRFVFIIDRSQSMGGQGLGVLAQAQTELTNAINKLEPNHSFQVVAYHSKTVTIAKRQLLTANAENKSMVKPFLQRLAAFGSTEHIYGINAALAFKPDAVVLLTDGGYPGLSVAELNDVRKATGNAEFHCIQFGLGPQQKLSNFMTKIASQSNGTFRYIDVRTWDQ